MKFKRVFIFDFYINSKNSKNINDEYSLQAKNTLYATNDVCFSNQKMKKQTALSLYARASLCDLFSFDLGKVSHDSFNSTVLTALTR